MPDKPSQRRPKRPKAYAERERTKTQTVELPLWPEKVEGGSLVRMLEKHVAALRDETAHGNRELFLDDIFVVYLLAFFNPTLRTLRTVEDFSQTRQAQRHLTTPRICKSTLSDFHKLADAERLQPIIGELRAALGRKSAGGRTPADLPNLLKQVLAVDGTFFSAAADVAWAVGHRNQRSGTRYRARLDVHVDVQTWLPEIVVVPEPGEGEAHSASRTVTPGAIHVYDRGIASFEMLAAHYTSDDGQWTPQAHFVLRMKKPGSGGFAFVATEQQALSPAAQAAGIESDRLGSLPGSRSSKAPPIVVREITIRMADGEQLRLLTNLLDVEPEIIGLLYRHRWQVELFFRWLKCYAHFDHLISHSRQGVLLNFYVVVIGVMLMYLHTGGRPSKYAFVLLGLLAQGGEASLDDLLPILRERERQCERDRQSAALRRAKKKVQAQ